MYEVFERMAYYGISSNLVVYLTKKLHQGTVKSSNNVTNWVGTIWLTPILGAYVADAHLGRYWTFVVASVIYLSVCMHAAISSFLYRTHALLLVQLPALSRPKNETIFGPHVSIQISYVNTVSYISFSEHVILSEFINPFIASCTVFLITRSNKG